MNLDKSQGSFMFLHVCIYIYLHRQSKEKVKWFIHLYFFSVGDKVNDL